MTHRRAISLAELLVVLSASTIIMTTSISLLHRTMHSQSATRVFVDSERSALRLSEQFRRDVHDAVSATIDEKSDSTGPTLRLKCPDDLNIQYEPFQDDSLVRTTSQPGYPPTRDQFTFRTPLTYAARQEAAPPTVILTLSAGATNPDAPDAGALPPGAFAAPTRLEVVACHHREPVAASPTSTREAP
jgi:hypothetical protein